MKATKYRVGVIASSFDILHPGYIKMLNQAKEHCEHLFVLLHTDPTVERPHKNKPILSVSERHDALRSNRNVDAIYIYNTEAELYELLKKIQPDVRFLGDDYRDNTKYTGVDLGIPVVWVDRSHGWSLTKLRQLINESASGQTKKE